MGTEERKYTSYDEIKMTVLLTHFNKAADQEIKSFLFLENKP